MTIRFVKYWNGYSPDAIIHNLGSTEEARLVSLGYATTDLDGPGSPEGELVRTITTPSGGVVIAGGGGDLPFPGAIPRGMSWLNDSISGFDIYSKGFVETPNIFFDPSKAATSLNRGSFQHPYTTQAQLQAIIKGDMHGKKLGIARGTKLQVTGTNGLNFAGVYGASGDPFMIIPYGDAEALPIVSSEAAVTTWALCAGSSTIYKYTLATESDIWQNGTRVWKLNPTSGSTNNNTGTTVNSEATAVTALSAKGAGWSVYYGGVLYFYPYSGENPNLGQCLIAVSKSALNIQYSDVASSGNIWVAGLDTRISYGSTFTISAMGTANITSVGGIQVVGNRVTQCGRDDVAGIIAKDAIIIYGPSDAVRISSLYVAGNEMGDVLFHSLELGGIDGTTAGNAVVEFNYGHDVGGNGICEMWSSCSNIILRYNKAERMSFYNRALQTGKQGGLYVANRYWDGTTWNSQDTANTRNTGIIAYTNLVVNPVARGFDIEGGSGHKVQQNTVIVNGSNPIYANATANQSMIFVSTGAVANGPAEGFVNVSNNLFAAVNMSSCNIRPAFIYCQHATLGQPSGDNNTYFQDANNLPGNQPILGAPGSAKNYWSGGGSGSSWLDYTATLVGAGANMDANSKTSLWNSSFVAGSVTTANLLLDHTNYTVSPSSIIAAAGKANLGLGTRHRLGNVRNDAAPTAGSEGTA